MTAALEFNTDYYYKFYDDVLNIDAPISSDTILDIRERFRTGCARVRAIWKSIHHDRVDKRIMTEMWLLPPF